MNKLQLIHNSLWKTKSIVVLSVLAWVLGSGTPLPALEPGSSVSQGATNPATGPSNPNGDLAEEAGDDFKGGAKTLGSGFKKGTKVTGRAFKKAGTTMGRAFKKVGSSIKEFFVGKKDSGVEERDLNKPAEPSGEGGMEPIQYDQDLDAVGDEAPPKAQAWGEAKSPNS